MSVERTKVVEAFFAAWNRQDLAAALEIADEDFEYVNPPNAVEPGTRRGADGITTVMTKQWEALGDGALLEVDRMHHLEDHVIAETRLSRGMPESSARVEVKAVLRCTFDGDRFIRMEVLGTGPTFDEGLAEAGVG
ncbi:MAG: SnoaL-like domain [Solirubrobacterales bacterium]|nr:SnoaL-like domain [Solirubrobacterales bacterium]